MGRVDDELAIDTAHANGSDGSHERHFRDVQGGRCRHNAQKIGLVDAIDGKKCVVDLELIVVAIRKKRTNRAVCQTRRENFLLARALLALEIPTGKTATAVILFAIFHLERKIVDSFAGSGRGNGRENDGVT